MVAILYLFSVRKRSILLAINSFRMTIKGQKMHLTGTRNAGLKTKNTNQKKTRIESMEGGRLLAL